MAKRVELPPDVTLEWPGEGAVVVCFTGEHDLATRDSTRQLLAGLVETNRLVVTDFSKTKFVDGLILEVVRESDRLARAVGHVLRLQFGTAPVVEMMFRVTGVLDELDCAPSREEALRQDPRPGDTRAGQVVDIDGPA